MHSLAIKKWNITGDQASWVKIFKQPLNQIVNLSPGGKKYFHIDRDITTHPPVIEFFLHGCMNSIVDNLSLFI